uniref:Uncharacterized protein n=1 Tax=Sipha flava TaxID=143950 RepID=A0A2S2R2K1_9HEMI
MTVAVAVADSTSFLLHHLSQVCQAVHVSITLYTTIGPPSNVISATISSSACRYNLYRCSYLLVATAVMSALLCNLLYTRIPVYKKIEISVKLNKHHNMRKQ